MHTLDLRSHTISFKLLIEEYIFRLLYIYIRYPIQLTLNIAETKIKLFQVELYIGSILSNKEATFTKTVFYFFL